jgi:hypothetical protein
MRNFRPSLSRSRNSAHRAVWNSGFRRAGVSAAFFFYAAGALLSALTFGATAQSSLTQSRRDSDSGHERVASASSLAPVAGSWSIVSSPDAGSGENNFLSGIACSAASDCWAVGHYISGSIQQTLIEHWDGVAWTIAPSPNSSAAQTNTLVAVACASSSDCWAGGYYSNGPGAQLTLIEHWDGVSWHIFNSPNASPSYNVLDGVTCASTSDCWIVGYSSTGPLVPGSQGAQFQSLTEHWDGASWAIVPSPTTGPTQNNLFTSITCVSGDNCWAVGVDSIALGVTGVRNQTLTSTWDGNMWSIVRSADNGATNNNFLSGVACVLSGDCWAVGEYNTGSTYQTLIERWDGSSWSIVSSPNIGSGQDNSPDGIACDSSGGCWVVGDYNNGVTYQTLIERWDGSSWTVFSSPNSSSDEFNILTAVTCVSTTDCWAAGYHASGSIYQTLIEHYVVSPVQVNAIVSRKAHGSAGTFDIDLTSGNGIECRSGGANNDYTLVFTFASTLASVDGASVTSGIGSVNSGGIDSNDAHNYSINLTGVANAQRITVSLSNVADSLGDFSSSVSATIGVLIADVNASGRVDAADVSAVRQQTLQQVTLANFRADINSSGRIDAADVSIARQQTLTALP